MDRHSEVEAKFEADGLTPGQVQAFVDSLPGRGYWRCRQYLKADGVDTFYRIGEGVFRSRRDDIRTDRRYDPSGNWEDQPERVDCCLTVKERKSDRNLLDRHEVDLHVGRQDPDDVRAFVRLLGGTEAFRIAKTYDVWMLQCGGFGTGGYRPTGTELCLALYDASGPTAVTGDASWRSRSRSTAPAAPRMGTRP